ncbi:MAG TPA: tRNA-uridine aminocarboxypropyltransferase [Planctomycetota bacterium]|nr:tRNA-uridine aminocarboxypropyltransferase [Planctomycetota bacterium]
MSDRRAPWCAGCRQPPARCICSYLPRARNETPLVVLRHPREEHSQSNTGSLCVEALTQARMLSYAGRGADLSLPRESVLLFPVPSAPILSRDLFLRAPLSDRALVILDATWRQARRMYVRSDALRGLTIARLPDEASPRWRLRMPKRAGQLSTIEAAALGYRLLGEERVAEALERVIDLVAPRVLAARQGDQRILAMAGRLHEKALASSETSEEDELR